MLSEHQVGEKIKESLKDTAPSGMVWRMLEYDRIGLNPDTPLTVFVPGLHTFLYIVEGNGVVSLIADGVVHLPAIGLGYGNIHAPA